jgi:hypothetical protein
MSNMTVTYYYCVIKTTMFVYIIVDNKESISTGGLQWKVWRSSIATSSTCAQR